MWEVPLADPLFESALGLDFEELHLNERRVGWHATEVGDDVAAFLFPTLVHEPSRGLRHEENADTEDERGKDLNGDGDKPGGFALAITRTTYEVRAYGSRRVSTSLLET